MQCKPLQKGVPRESSGRGPLSRFGILSSRNSFPAWSGVGFSVVRALAEQVWGSELGSLGPCVHADNEHEWRGGAS